MKPIRRRRRPGKNQQLELLRSLQAQFPEVAYQLQPAIDAGGFKECFLCGKPVAWLGFFNPGKKREDHKAFGAPEGKFRNWLYGLCINCFNRPGVQAEIEALLMAEARAGKARFN